MMTLTARPYAGETDLQPLVDLFNACEAVDQQDDFHTVNELRLEFNDPLIDQTRDLCLWEDGEGRLIGFAQLWIPQAGAEQDAWLWFRIHPHARSAGLDKDVLNWAETQLEHLRQERGVPVVLRTGCRDNNQARIALLERAGMTCDRRFLTMVKSLIPPIPEPQFPEGFRLKQASGQEDAEQWVAMYNQTFIDHWGYHPERVEERLYWLEHDPHYRPKLDLVAIAPDGTYAAFCVGHINPEYNTERNCNEGWIGRLGVRRGFRRLGLGRAMLLAGMQALWEAGVDTAKLGVDAQNPNQAMHLYESVGFRKLHTRLTYSKSM